ncbi:MAG: AAA family ATPase [Phycisphaerales bacterium]|nr:AAA family ATPase [Phycisphaerales bacterium]
MSGKNTMGPRLTPEPAKSPIDTLAQDARVSPEPRMPAKGQSPTAEQIAELRDRVNARAGQANLSNRDIARQTGLGTSTISQWRNGRYEGDVDQVARKLAYWLEQHARGERPGLPDGFVRTRVAERILGVLKDTQARRWMSVVYGPAGVGKSLCFRAALELIPGSVHVEVVEGASGPMHFARQWCRALGLPQHGSLYAMEMRLIDAIRGSKRLQMIDEAHYLNVRALHVIRDVHKQSGCGVVIGGTIDVEQKVDDASEFYGQLSSLLLHRYDIVGESAEDGDPLFTVDDVLKVAESMRVRLTRDGAEYASDRASIPGSGGLRSLVGLLYNASLVAQGERVDAKLLRSCERTSQGRANYERVQLRREQRRKAAVA